MAKYLTRAAAVAGIALIGLMAVLVAGCSDTDKKLASADPRDREKGVRELGQRADEEALKKLETAVADPHEKVATVAVETMGRMRTPAAKEAVRKVATEDKRAVVRQEAVAQVVRQGTREAKDTARQIVKADPDPMVRSQAVDAFVIERSREDVPLLVEIAESEQDLRVQTRAVRAIEAILGVTFRYDPAASAAERKKALERVRMSAAMVAAEQGAALRAKSEKKGR